MARRSADIITALVLLAFSGGAYWQSLQIQTRDDGVMRADVWPQTIIVALGVLSAIYLLRSLREPLVEPVASAGDNPRQSWLVTYANPLICFALYFAFLATLPWLGVLIGGTLLVFLILSALGGWSPAKLALHAAVAIGSVGLMWAIFTFALRVAMPSGVILPLILPR